MDSIMRSALIGRRVAIPRSDEVIVISDIEVTRNFATMRLNGQYDISFADAQNMLALPEPALAKEAPESPSGDPGQGPKDSDSNTPDDSEDKKPRKSRKSKE